MVAAKISNLEQGGDRQGEEFKGPIGPLNQPKVSIEVAAEKLNVSDRSTRRAETQLLSRHPSCYNYLGMLGYAASRRKGHPWPQPPRPPLPTANSGCTSQVPLAEGVPETRALRNHAHLLLPLARQRA
jgi:hypothetical protein